ncbi:hypothetical protein Ocin01_12691, partial [Orchesella cincta]
VPAPPAGQCRSTAFLRSPSFLRSHHFRVPIISDRSGNMAYFLCYCRNSLRVHIIIIIPRHRIILLAPIGASSPGPKTPRIFRLPFPWIFIAELADSSPSQITPLPFKTDECCHLQNTY